MPFNLNIAANTKEIVRLEVAFGEYYLHIIDEVCIDFLYFVMLILCNNVLPA